MAPFLARLPWWGIMAPLWARCDCIILVISLSLGSYLSGFIFISFLPPWLLNISRAQLWIEILFLIMSFKGNWGFIRGGMKKKVP